MSSFDRIVLAFLFVYVLSLFWSVSHDVNRCEQKLDRLLREKEEK